MRILSSAFIIIFLCISMRSSPANAQTALDFSHCVNIANALEAPNEGEWGVFIEEEFMQDIADAGFTTIRLPVKWSGHALATAPYTIDPAFMNRIIQVVGWALDANLNVVLNIHHYDEIMTNPAAHTARVIAIWQQIATQFATYPTTLAFELLNEPNNGTAAWEGGLNNSTTWNNLYPQLINTIRTTNPPNSNNATRTIIFGGVQWNSYLRVNELVLPADKSNLIVTFHYYEPFEFTHQGADWVSGLGSEEWQGTLWGLNQADYDAIESHFEGVRVWADANDIPIWVGEFGSFSNSDATPPNLPTDHESRMRYTAAVRSIAEEKGFGWCYWELAAGFGIYDKVTHTFTDLYEALIPPQVMGNVTGNVQDALANPLPNVPVWVDGQADVVCTDGNGDFTLLLLTGQTYRIGAGGNHPDCPNTTYALRWYPDSQTVQYAQDVTVPSVNINFILPQLLTTEMNEQLLLAKLQAQAVAVDATIYPLLVDITPTSMTITLRHDNGSIGGAQLAFSGIGMVQITITQTTGIFTTDIQQQLPQILMSAMDDFLGEQGILAIPLEKITLTASSLLFARVGN
ncbi:MAG: cellulase family glycosylhydrolase [bacterium]|nr:cellulase family glycosylhydrolase [bacterium]